MNAGVVDQFSFQHQDQFGARVQVHRRPGSWCISQQSGCRACTVVSIVIELYDFNAAAPVGRIGLPIKVAVSPALVEDLQDGGRVCGPFDDSVHGSLLLDVVICALLHEGRSLPRRFLIGVSASGLRLRGLMRATRSVNRAW
jgi:hypothetical protein